MVRTSTIFVLVVVLIIAAVLLALANMSLSALNEPGRVETYLANEAKEWLVGRNARRGLPPEPVVNENGVKEGRKLYGVDCSICHGADGRTPTETGRWMYPRVPDLGSADVQEWSNRELFWIVKNGIRLSGMPAFGKVESDQNIWNIVHYVRTLGGPQTLPAKK